MCDLVSYFFQSRAAHVIVQPLAIILQPFMVCTLSPLGTPGNLCKLNRLTSFPAPVNMVEEDEPSQISRCHNAVQNYRHNRGSYL